MDEKEMIEIAQMRSIQQKKVAELAREKNSLEGELRDTGRKNPRRATVEDALLRVKSELEEAEGRLSQIPCIESYFRHRDGGVTNIARWARKNKEGNPEVLSPVDAVREGVLLGSAFQGAFRWPSYDDEREALRKLGLRDNGHGGVDPESLPGGPGRWSGTAPGFGEFLGK